MHIQCVKGRGSLLRDRNPKWEIQKHRKQPSSSSERETVEGGTQAAGMAVVTMTSSKQADHMQEDGHPVRMTAA